MPIVTIGIWQNKGEALKERKYVFGKEKTQLFLGMLCFNNLVFHLQVSPQHPH